MKTQLKMLSLVLSIAFSGILLTQCVKNEESDGVRTVREGYAEKLKGDADYNKALAEKERAEAEKIRITAQWEKDKAAADVGYRNAETELQKAEAELKKVEVELEKVKVEHLQNLNDLKIAEKEVELEKKKAELEETKAFLDAQIQGHKNTLLGAQHDYEKAVIDNERKLINANILLANAQAKLLANDPNLVEYQAWYTKLFVNPGYYGERTTLLVKKLGFQTDILGLQYATNEEWLAWLKRDSVKAGEELKYTKDLLVRYENLDGLSVAALQAKADEAKIAWTSASVTAAEKNVAVTEAQIKHDEEDTKLTAEQGKLDDIKNKLTTSSASYTFADSLIDLNPYNSAAFVYPAPVSDLASTYTISKDGYKDILKYVTDRLTYLKSDINDPQSSGYIPYTPTDANPTKKYLEEQIAHIEDVLVPAIGRQIEEQEVRVADAETKLEDGKTAWASAETAYKASVDQVNNTAAALRTQLPIWKKAATDSSDKFSTTDLTTAQQIAFFNPVKNYYVARYNFDRLTTSGSVTTYIPAEYAELSAATFNYTAFFATNSLGTDWGTQLSLIDVLEDASNIKIVNNYEYYNFEGSSLNGSIDVTFPSSTSTVDKAPVNGRLGALLYLSRAVYGASTLTDIHYFLPYETTVPATVTVGSKTPVFINYDDSFFGLWEGAASSLTAMKAAKANTLYIENYKTVLALVERTITFYENLKAEYEALVAETEAAIAAQQIVVNEQTEVVAAAKTVKEEATVVYNTALKHAGNLEALYDLLKDSEDNTLGGIIKARIKELEKDIKDPDHDGDGLIKDVEEANAAILAYIGGDNAGKVVADNIAKKEAKIKDIDAQIAALGVIIDDIEAKMQALLQQPSLE
jgi:hypothetical protein